MEANQSQKDEAVLPTPYQSLVDNRPLTDREKALWWVMGVMGLFSMLLLFVLMALFHTPLAAN
ncbi:MAG: hypothetical protein V4671_30015 [Armatimonadota bacterium]